MTPSTKCRVNAISLGEVTVNALSDQAISIAGKFALVREDGARVGQFSKGLGWSEKTRETFEAFRLSLEQDAALEVFDSPPIAQAEPPQI